MSERISKRLIEPCRPSMTTLCPTMDLVATVSQKNTVDVWRFNGQRVFGFTSVEDEPDRKVDGVSWRSDGKIIAVALSTALVVLIDSFAGKVAHQIHVASASPHRPTPPNEDYPATFLSLQAHFSNASQVKRQLEDVKRESALYPAAPIPSLEDLLGLKADIAKLLKVKADLPRELSRLEVEVALPKLSTLPATGADDELFSSRHAIDTMFHPHSVSTEDKSDLINVLIASAIDCVVQVSMFDSFVIGTVNLGSALPKSMKDARIRHSISHPLLSTHYVTIEAGRPGSLASSTHLVSLDLRYISQTNHNLPLLATKVTQLQNLLRYLLQISNQLSAEVRTAFDLPSRFVENVNESLTEQDSSADFMTESYHLILTGTCSDNFREWLVDQVGDRGLKRWEKAVGDCLDMIRRMTSECLLPAIERAQIVISRLDGLSRFADTATRMGLEEQKIRVLREVLDALSIHCEDMLRDVCSEIREFAAFMRWLKWEAEVQTLGEDSERAEELRESYQGESEIRIVLDYIESAMKKSRVTLYVKADPKQELEELQQETEIVNFYKKARRTSNMASLPALSDLLRVLELRSKEVFDCIADTLRKSILVEHITELPRLSRSHQRIVFDQEQGHHSLHILHHDDQSPTAVQVLSINLTAGSRSGTASGVKTIVQLPAETQLLDFKIRNDHECLMLVTEESSGDRLILTRPLSGENHDWEERHRFVSGGIGSGMQAGLLEVNGREGSNSVVVMDANEMGFVIVDIATE
jgi:anaphase-promoting complex subunit 4